MWGHEGDERAGIRGGRVVRSRPSVFISYLRWKAEMPACSRPGNHVVVKRCFVHALLRHVPRDSHVSEATRHLPPSGCVSTVSPTSGGLVAVLQMWGPQNPVKSEKENIANSQEARFLADFCQKLKDFD